MSEGMRPEIQPFPHQARAIQRLLENDGSLVMAHGVGSGKTISSLAGFDQLRQQGKAHKAIVVVPAGLKSNYSESITKFTTFSQQTLGAKGGKEGVYYDKLEPNKTFTLVSYDMFRRDAPRLLALTGADTLIFDEYHKARTAQGRTYRAAMEVRPSVRNFIGLTGSVVNNDPKEIIPLVNLAAGQEVMSPKAFDSRYKRRYARSKGFFGGRKYLTAMVNIPDLKKRIGKHVDYISTEAIGKEMPRRTVETVKVPMSDEQKKLYEWTLGRVDRRTAWKIRNNLPVDQKEAALVFTRILQARQAMNSIQPFVRDVSLGEAARRTPKVQKLLDDTERHFQETPDGQVVIYSNLIKGGVDVLTAGLKDRGIEHAIFIGKGREIGGQKVTAETRNQGVGDFLAGKKKVIVLSGAGAEGLDLKNATLFQSLDAHFNPERIRQAEARARRLKGLSHRPLEQRVVQVRRYESVYPKAGFFGRLFGRGGDATVDQWVTSVAREKHRLNEQFRSALQQPPLPKAPLAKALPAKAAPTKLAPILPTKVKAPPKYLRRWRDPMTQEWRYEYA